MSDTNTDFDFGFTAVDTEEFTRSTTSSTSSNTPIVAEVSNEQMLVLSKKIADLSTQVSAQITAIKPASTTQINRVEEKLDKILAMELQELSSSIAHQGDSFGSVLTEIETRRVQTQTECREKLKEIEGLILPLLINLMKNPEKEYIHWPNRSEKIQTQINKIVNCTKSFGV